MKFGTLITMTESNIDIGFLEERENWLLHPRFFPSKVGGKPSWLDLKSLPSPDDLSCQICKDPLIFLCQVYAPCEELPLCFHRTFFIFICKNGGCCRTNRTDNLVVYRCQLPRENEFYSFNPYAETKDEEFSTNSWAKLCDLCGSKAPSHCSKCKKIYYCSRKHQILDWQKGHKEKCLQFKNSELFQSNDFAITDAGKGVLFKEWELIVDEEDEKPDVDVNESNEMEKLRTMMQEKKAGTLNNISDDELQQYTQNIPEDKIFNRFSKRVARHPDQVLRYDKGGEPLWITSLNESSTNVPPNCEYCGGERQFEFQIMPQLLNYIDVGVELNSIDWGVLVIYTCKESCSGDPVYKKEFIVKQDLCK